MLNNPISCLDYIDQGMIIINKQHYEIHYIRQLNLLQMQLLFRAFQLLEQK
jgi:hypothetical protein